MKFDELIEYAKTIKHCGDYGELWINELTGGVWWVAGDADFDPDEVEKGYCTGDDDIRKAFLAMEGVTSVEIEAEYSPDGEEGWAFIGKFGIDNYFYFKGI